MDGTLNITDDGRLYAKDVRMLERAILETLIISKDLKITELIKLVKIGFPEYKFLQGTVIVLRTAELIKQGYILSTYGSTV